jgi:hypothetical protein
MVGRGIVAGALAFISRVGYRRVGLAQQARGGISWGAQQGDRMISWVIDQRLVQQSTLSSMQERSLALRSGEVKVRLRAEVILANRSCLPLASKQVQRLLGGPGRRQPRG